MDRELGALQRQVADAPDARSAARLATHLERKSALEAAASAWDRAYGFDPDDPTIARDRARVLDALEVREHGLVFRYVPAGRFRMGDARGEPDAQHERDLDLPAFWIADVPLSWTALRAAQGLEPPPEYAGGDVELPYDQWWSEVHKVRLRYCVEGDPWRDDVSAEACADRPVVAVSLGEAQWVGDCLSSEGFQVRLPTEPEWEKAARGGRVGAWYPWGDAPPTRDRCDAEHFGEFSVAPSRSLPPNGYGVYAMSGGVWEWTCTPYDALAYREPDAVGPERIEESLLIEGEREVVVRGGSFVDVGLVCTVSYRHALSPQKYLQPTVGARLVRVPAVDERE